MGLPTAREYTVTSATPVTSALLNALQDSVIGAKHPAIDDWRFPAWLYTSGTAWTFLAGPGAYYWTSGGAAVGVAQVSTRVGDRITGYKAKVYGNGVVDCQHRLVVLDASMNATELLAAANDINRAAAWGEYAPVPTAHVMAAGESLIVSIEPNAANYRVGSIGITRDRL